MRSVNGHFVTEMDFASLKDILKSAAFPGELSQVFKSRLPSANQPLILSPYFESADVIAFSIVADVDTPEGKFAVCWLCCGGATEGYAPDLYVWEALSI